MCEVTTHGSHYCKKKKKEKKSIYLEFKMGENQIVKNIIWSSHNCVLGLFFGDNFGSQFASNSNQFSFSIFHYKNNFPSCAASEGQIVS